MAQDAQAPKQVQDLHLDWWSTLTELESQASLAMGSGCQCAFSMDPAWLWSIGNSTNKVGHITAGHSSGSWQLLMEEQTKQLVKHHMGIIMMPLNA